MVRRSCLTCNTSSLFLLLSFCLPLCLAIDSLMLNDFISDNETIISNGEEFELGFFTPINRSNDSRRYVGIWYYPFGPSTVVWVANRERPLNNTKGAFGIGEDGNLVLLDQYQNSVWNTNFTHRNETIVKLTDFGNLILETIDKESNSSQLVWDSFSHPTDTFLPGMKLDEKIVLTSWASYDNPAEGQYKFQREEDQYIIKKDKYDTHWKSPVSGNKFISIAPDNKVMSSDVIPQVSDVLSNSSTNYSSKSNRAARQQKSRVVIKFDGVLKLLISSSSNSWDVVWKEPADSCSVFKACGNSAVCNSNKNEKCECLPGFERVNLNSEDFSEGCQRTMPVCNNSIKVRNFTSLKVTKVRRWDNTFEFLRTEECRDECLKDCNCQAYTVGIPTTSSRSDETCWIWTENLNNIEQDNTDRGFEIFLRVHIGPPLVGTVAPPPGYHGSDETTKQKKEWTLTIAVVVIVSVIALAFIGTIAFIFRRKTKVKARGSNLPNDQKHVKELIDQGGLNDEDKKGIDIPFFDFKMVLEATDHFSETNMLGKGGFGPVYKGKFSEGKEIAVKRLSKVSGQGMEEFRNEVVLIARLQHRNLVRLLGYCIEGDEKILLYEFMPNKSLDSFIFDPNLKELLDWEMRFNIILGIVRGLLYLHQDSRLRIIHRDLKTSNILLDDEMNPKISDFGLARIFEGKQTEGATNRVVGTYGYMSPEYALDGIFSVKSDIFSFGVVVLEIISGKRNTGFYNSSEALSLLGYVWKLWQEDKVLDMVDENLISSSKTKIDEVLKCITVGLLCVQEDPDDRPSMSEVVILLSSVTTNLPTPKRPAFVVRRVIKSVASASSSKVETNNEISITLEGR